MIIGTAHFVSRETAYAYYAQQWLEGQRDPSLRAAVDKKIEKREIHIGKPKLLNEGEKVIVIDEGKRYAIDDGKK